MKRTATVTILVAALMLVAGAFGEGLPFLALGLAPHGQYGVVIRIEVRRIEAVIEEPGLTDQLQQAIGAYEGILVLSLPHAALAVREQIDGQSAQPGGHRTVVGTFRLPCQGANPDACVRRRPEPPPVVR